MTWLLISAIPVLILLIFGNRLPNEVVWVLRAACLPFIFIMALYSFILGGAIVIAFIALIKYQQYKFKKMMEKENHIYEGQVISRRYHDKDKV